MSGPNDNRDAPSQPQARGSARFFGRRINLQTPAEALHPQEAPPPPPGKPNSERRPILSAMSGAFSLALVVALVALAATSFAIRNLGQPGPLASDKVIFIAPGTEVVQIIDKLEKEKVIDNATMLKASLWAQRNWSKVKAGEYLFKAHITPKEVINILVSGKQLLHSVTIPEGLTSEQIVERLRANEVLAGDIKDTPPEGTLLPDTYKVARGSSRALLVRKMRREQDRVLEQIWAKRSKLIPLKSKYELLTLAAIIEKETGRADERTRVAAVFYNRLRKGMRLQSDPTIVYGLVGGKGTLGRPIQRDEIRKPTPYNTYVIPALPPGPIANPGRAALEAAANPSQTNDLFFVANGTGGHAFAELLADHNRNVARWRQIEKEQAEAAKQGAQPGNGAPAASEPSVDRAEPEAEAPPAAPARGRRGRGASLGVGPFGVLGGLTPAKQPASEPNKAAREAELRANRERATAMLRQKLNAAFPSEPAATPSAALALAPVAQPAAAASTPAQKAIAKAVAVAPDKSNIAASAPVQSPVEQKPATGKFAVAPGLEALNLKIVGVTPDVTDSPLDGPLSDDDDDRPGIDPSSIASVPMSAAKRAELEARAEKFAGAKPSPAGSTVLPRSAPEAIPDADAERKAPTKTAGLGAGRRRIYDASEGTRYDPLKAKKWDLNATQSIPSLR